MLDIRFIRENATLLQQVADTKGIDMSIEELLEFDRKRRRILQHLEQQRSSRNRLSKEIGHLARQNQPQKMEEHKQHVRRLNENIKELENDLQQVVKNYDSLLALVPNIVSPDAPVGTTDEDNVEIKKVGQPTTFAFEAQDHVELGKLHDMFDTERGVKVSGSRQYFLKNDGFHLHRAVQQLALDLLSEKRFTMLDIPMIVREEAMHGTGFFPTGREQTYALEKEAKYLIGTSEVSLVAYCSNEEWDVTEPIRLAAVSPCLRIEAGSAGRDVRGLYRVHQFSKVEQVIICRDNIDLSEELLKEITANAEELLERLELPYRIVAVCTGDMSQKNYKQYDIETWMPSRGGYGETHSASSLLDFQARRANIRYRYRDADGQLKYCFTLNNTMVASPRILIPLLENHQQADGSIYIPAALRPYMGGREFLTTPHV
jgi:seryl-tRNA synthetase